MVLVSLYYILSPSAWVDQRSRQGDIIVITVRYLPAQKPYTVQTLDVLNTCLSPYLSCTSIMQLPDTKL